MSQVSAVASRDQEIREVVAELDGLLGQLRANVEALSAILVPPNGNPAPPGKELSTP